jgi:hypothetical protein
MQAPISDIAINRCSLEWINAMKQIVLCAQIPHDIIRPRLTSRLERYAKALAIYATKKRREIGKIFARWEKRLRALEENDLRMDGPRDFEGT